MVIGSLLLVCFVVMMGQQAEGHITFFSPGEMKALKEKEEKKVMETRSEDGQIEKATVQLSQEEGDGISDNAVEISMHLSAKRLDHVAPMLEEVLQGIME